MEAGLQGRLSLHHDTKPPSCRWKDQYPSLGTFESRDDTSTSHSGITGKGLICIPILLPGHLTAYPVVCLGNTLVHLTSYSVVIIIEFSTGIRKAWRADCIIHDCYAS